MFHVPMSLLPDPLFLVGLHAHLLISILMCKDFQLCFHTTKCTREAPHNILTSDKRSRLIKSVSLLLRMPQYPNKRRLAITCTQNIDDYVSQFCKRSKVNQKCEFAINVLMKHWHLCEPDFVESHHNIHISVYTHQSTLPICPLDTNSKS